MRRVGVSGSQLWSQSHLKPIVMRDSFWLEYSESSLVQPLEYHHLTIRRKIPLQCSKMTWKQLTERDRRDWKLSAIDPNDKDTWRSGVRSAMRAASQLPGRGPTVVDMAPVPAC